MIDIKLLTKEDVGRWVIYNPGYKIERGKIKSWNDSGIFVVYNSPEWAGDIWKEYTAAHTRPEDLEFLSKEDSL